MSERTITVRQAAVTMQAVALIRSVELVIARGGCARGC